MWLQTVMQLLDEGAVDLNAPVRRYVPNCASPTVRQRTPSPSAISCSRPWAARRRRWPSAGLGPGRGRSPTPCANSSASSWPRRRGARWQYANANYVLAGLWLAHLGAGLWPTTWSAESTDRSDDRQFRGDHPPPGRAGPGPGTDSTCPAPEVSRRARPRSGNRVIIALESVEVAQVQERGLRPRPSTNQPIVLRAGRPWPRSRVVAARGEHRLQRLGGDDAGAVGGQPGLEVHAQVATHVLGGGEEVAGGEQTRSEKTAGLDRKPGTRPPSRAGLVAVAGLQHRFADPALAQRQRRRVPGVEDRCCAIVNIEFEMSPVTKSAAGNCSTRCRFAVPACSMML